jgi:hypothetical protein
VRRRVGRGERGAAVDADSAAARAAGIAGHRHVDDAVGGEQVPRDGRRRVAQHSALTAREHRRQPTALAGQHSMTDRVDAAVHEMQASRAQTMVDSVAAHIQRRQLRPRHDSVLRPCELGDVKVPGALTAHIAVSAPGGEVRPPQSAARPSARVITGA